MLATSLLDHFASRNNFKLVVVFDTKIKSHDYEAEHSHEEADTQIPHQVLASIEDSAELRELCVCSPDTDVHKLLLDLVSCGLLGGHSLKFLTGKATN